MKEFDKFMENVEKVVIGSLVVLVLMLSLVQGLMLIR